MKKKLKKLTGKKIKNDIMDYLATEDGAFFGDLVMNMDENKITILEHLIKLKKKGLIYKDDGGGMFRINEEKAKRSSGTKKKTKKKTSRSKEKKETGKKQKHQLVEEMNEFSKAMKEGQEDADNEIAINKQAPQEQKVKHQVKKRK